MTVLQPLQDARRVDGADCAERRHRERAHSARADINGQKIDRQAFQVSYLADKILEGFQEGDLSNAGSKLNELKKVTNDLKTRAFSAGAKDLEELCVPLRTVVQSLIDSRGKFTKKDLSLLKQLSLAVRASVRPGATGTASVRDIAKTVIGAGAATG